MSKPGLHPSSGRVADSDPEPHGFERLLPIDPESGEIYGQRTVYAPTLVARDVNDARRTLGLHLNDPAARRHACVGPVAEPVPVIGEGDHDVDPVAGLPSGPNVSAAQKLDRAASPAAHQSPLKPRAPGWRFVRVVTEGALLAQRRDLGHGSSYLTAEKKTRIKLLDALLARGDWRPIGRRHRGEGLLAQWRVDMPNFGRVIDHVEACCALSRLTRTPLRIAPILLAGLPGVGKTHFATRLASLLGVAQFVYALESAETVSVLCGSDKHWGNTEPGMLYNLILLGEHANPVIVLDELDKTNPGSTYRPANALHTVLEPVTARMLRDKSVDLVFDASYAVYVATANRLSTIDASLLSRFELFHIEPPDARGSVAIARSIGRDMWAALKLARRIKAPSGEVIQQLALLRDPRRMHKVLRAALGRMVLAGRDRMTAEDLVGGLGETVEGGRGRERAH